MHNPHVLSAYDISLLNLRSSTVTFTIAKKTIQKEFQKQKFRNWIFTRRRRNNDYYSDTPVTRNAWNAQPIAAGRGNVEERERYAPHASRTAGENKESNEKHDGKESRFERGNDVDFRWLRS